MRRGQSGKSLGASRAAVISRNIGNGLHKNYEAKALLLAGVYANLVPHRPASTFLPAVGSADRSSQIPCDLHHRDAIVPLHLGRGGLAQQRAHMSPNPKMSL